MSDCFSLAALQLQLRITSPWMGICRLDASNMEREKLASSQSWERAGTPTLGTITSPRLFAFWFKLHPASAGLEYCKREPARQIILLFAVVLGVPACSGCSSSQLLVRYPVDREANHFICIGKAEFFFYVRAMGLNGFDAKIDLFGD